MHRTPKASIVSFTAKALLGALLVPALATPLAAHGGVIMFGPGANGGGCVFGPSGPVGPVNSGPTTGGNPGPAGPAVGPASGPATAGAVGSLAAGATTGGFAAVQDLADWSLWWEFNKHEFLQLKARIYTADAETSDDNFFLGLGQENSNVDRLRPSPRVVQEIVVPELLRALKRESHQDVISGCLIALARIGDGNPLVERSDMAAVITPFLSDGNQEIAETAALALGILASEQSEALLTELMEDTPRARKQLSRSDSVPMRTRVFAAYGLGLVGARTESDSLRRWVIESLFKALQADDSAQPDLSVACLMGIGMTRLEKSSPPAGFDDLSLMPVSACRLSQIHALRQFSQRKGLERQVQAHLLTAISRLCQGLPAQVLEPLKLELAEEWLPMLGRFNTQPDEVVQSAVQALGHLGDADGDDIDKRIRKALIEVREHVSEPQARNFSYVALGRIAARPGTGGDLSGAEEILNSLISSATRGKNDRRRWAAIGLGVYGHTTHAAGRLVPNAVSDAVRNAYKSHRSPSDVGAFSIAIGLLGDAGSAEYAMQRLDKSGVDATHGYVAVGLGMLGARESLEPLRGIVRESKYRPELMSKACVALGLMGDKAVVPDLVDMLRESRSLASQASIASSMGWIGDARAVDPLVVMLRNQKLTGAARGFAAVSLGTVCDTSALPWSSPLSTGINYRAATSTLLGGDGRGVLEIL